MQIYEKPVKIEIGDFEILVNGKAHPRDLRKLSKLREVMRGIVDLDMSGDLDMYYMFRGIFKKGGIRFDITVIPGQVVEGECAKTYGHGHPVAEQGLSYPEIYQVLQGSAVFLLQQTNRDHSVNVKLIRGEKGDVLLIPPNYSHVTINPGKVTLVLANLVAEGFESDYSGIRKNKGAAFYYFPDGNIEQNAHYVVKNLERPKIAEFNKRFGFESKDLLAELDSDPKKFEFLKKPSLLIS